MDAYSPFFASGLLPSQYIPNPSGTDCNSIYGDYYDFQHLLPFLQAGEETTQLGCSITTPAPALPIASINIAPIAPIPQIVVLPPSPRTQLEFAPVSARTADVSTYSAMSSLRPPIQAVGQHLHTHRLPNSRHARSGRDFVAGESLDKTGAEPTRFAGRVRSGSLGKALRRKIMRRIPAAAPPPAGPLPAIPSLAQVCCAKGMEGGSTHHEAARIRGEYAGAVYEEKENLD